MFRISFPLDVSKNDDFKGTYKFISIEFDARVTEHYMAGVTEASCRSALKHSGAKDVFTSMRVGQYGRLRFR